MVSFDQKTEISQVISEKDNMLDNIEDDKTAVLNHYFSVSESAMNCIIFALQMAGKDKINSILDFPCGYGRVLRSLVSYFPEAEITACDIEKDAVDFCVETFSVNGVYSDTNPSKINLGRKYDLIWCGSLLTHLNKHDALRFYDFFLNHLEDNGILILSIQGRFSAKNFNCYFPHANTSNKIVNFCIKYSKLLIKSKIVRLFTTNRKYFYISKGFITRKGNSTPNCGVSVVKPSWVVSLFENNPKIRLIYYSERLWDNHQDILVVQKKCIDI